MLRIYRCINGFVCSDTLLAGECGKGTGAYVNCVKDQSSTPSPETQKPKPGGEVVRAEEQEDKESGGLDPASTLNQYLVPSLVIAVMAV